MVWCVFATFKFFASCALTLNLKMITLIACFFCGIFLIWWMCMCVCRLKILFCVSVWVCVIFFVVVCCFRRSSAFSSSSRSARSSTFFSSV